MNKFKSLLKKDIEKIAQDAGAEQASDALEKDRAELEGVIRQISNSNPYFSYSDKIFFLNMEIAVADITSQDFLVPSKDKISNFGKAFSQVKKYFAISTLSDYKNFVSEIDLNKIDNFLTDYASDTSQRESLVNMASTKNAKGYLRENSDFKQITPTEDNGGQDALFLNNAVKAVNEIHSKINLDEPIRLSSRQEIVLLIQNLKKAISIVSYIQNLYSDRKYYNLEYFINDIIVYHNRNHYSVEAEGFDENASVLNKILSFIPKNKTEQLQSSESEGYSFNGIEIKILEQVFFFAKNNELFWGTEEGSFDVSNSSFFKSLIRLKDVPGKDPSSIKITFDTPPDNSKHLLSQGDVYIEYSFDDVAAAAEYSIENKSFKITNGVELVNSTLNNTNFSYEAFHNAIKFYEVKALVEYITNNYATNAELSYFISNIKSGNVKVTDKSFVSTISFKPIRDLLNSVREQSTVIEQPNLMFSKEDAIKQLKIKLKELYSSKETSEIQNSIEKKCKEYSIQKGKYLNVGDLEGDALKTKLTENLLIIDEIILKTLTQDQLNAALNTGSAEPQNIPGKAKFLEELFVAQDILETGYDGIVAPFLGENSFERDSSVNSYAMKTSESLGEIKNISEISAEGRAIRSWTGDTSNKSDLEIGLDQSYSNDIARLRGLKIYAQDISDSIKVDAYRRLNSKYRNEGGSFLSDPLTVSEVASQTQKYGESLANGILDSIAGSFQSDLGITLSGQDRQEILNRSTKGLFEEFKNLPSRKASNTLFEGPTDIDRMRLVTEMNSKTGEIEEFIKFESKNSFDEYKPLIDKYVKEELFGQTSEEDSGQVSDAKDFELKEADDFDYKKFKLRGPNKNSKIRTKSSIIYLLHKYATDNGNGKPPLSNNSDLYLERNRFEAAKNYSELEKNLQRGFMAYFNTEVTLKLNQAAYYIDLFGNGVFSQLPSEIPSTMKSNEARLSNYCLFDSLTRYIEMESSNITIGTTTLSDYVKTRAFAGKGDSFYSEILHQIGLWPETADGLSKEEILDLFKKAFANSNFADDIINLTEAELKEAFSSAKKNHADFINSPKILMSFSVEYNGKIYSFPVNYDKGLLITGEGVKDLLSEITSEAKSDILKTYASRSNYSLHQLSDPSSPYRIPIETSSHMSLDASKISGGSFSNQDISIFEISKGANGEVTSLLFKEGSPTTGSFSHFENSSRVIEIKNGSSELIGGIPKISEDFSNRKFENEDFNMKSFYKEIVSNKQSEKYGLLDDVLCDALESLQGSEQKLGSPISIQNSHQSSITNMSLLIESIKFVSRYDLDSEIFSDPELQNKYVDQFKEISEEYLKARNEILKTMQSQGGMSYDDVDFGKVVQLDTLFNSLYSEINTRKESEIFSRINKYFGKNSIQSVLFDTNYSSKNFGIEISDVILGRVQNEIDVSSRINGSSAYIADNAYGKLRSYYGSGQYDKLTLTEDAINDLLPKINLFLKDGGFGSLSAEEKLNVLSYILEKSKSTLPEGITIKDIIISHEERVGTFNLNSKEIEELKRSQADSRMLRFIDPISVESFADFSNLEDGHKFKSYIKNNKTIIFNLLDKVRKESGKAKDFMFEKSQSAPKSISYPNIESIGNKRKLNEAEEATVSEYRTKNIADMNKTQLEAERARLISFKSTFKGVSSNLNKEVITSDIDEAIKAIDENLEIFKNETPRLDRAISELNKHLAQIKKDVQNSSINISDETLKLILGIEEVNEQEISKAYSNLSQLYLNFVSDVDPAFLNYILQDNMALTAVDKANIQAAIYSSIMNQGMNIRRPSVSITEDGRAALFSGYIESDLVGFNANQKGFSKEITSFLTEQQAKYGMSQLIPDSLFNDLSKYKADLRGDLSDFSARKGYLLPEDNFRLITAVSTNNNVIPIDIFNYAIVEIPGNEDSIRLVFEIKEGEKNNYADLYNNVSLEFKIKTLDGEKTFKSSIVLEEGFNYVDIYKNQIPKTYADISARTFTAERLSEFISKPRSLESIIPSLIKDTENFEFKVSWKKISATPSENIPASYMFDLELIHRRSNYTVMKAENLGIDSLTNDNYPSFVRNVILNQLGLTQDDVINSTRVIKERIEIGTARVSAIAKAVQWAESNGSDSFRGLETIGSSNSEISAIRRIKDPEQFKKLRNSNISDISKALSGVLNEYGVIKGYGSLTQAEAKSTQNFKLIEDLYEELSELSRTFNSLGYERKVLFLDLISKEIFELEAPSDELKDILSKFGFQLDLISERVFLGFNYNDIERLKSHFEQISRLQKSHSNYGSLDEFVTSFNDQASEGTFKITRLKDSSEISVRDLDSFVDIMISEIEYCKEVGNFEVANELEKHLIRAVEWRFDNGSSIITSSLKDTYLARYSWLNSVRADRIDSFMRFAHFFGLEEGKNLEGILSKNRELVESSLAAIDSDIQGITQNWDETRLEIQTAIEETNQEYERLQALLAQNPNHATTIEELTNIDAQLVLLEENFEYGTEQFNKRKSELLQQKQELERKVRLEGIDLEDLSLKRTTLSNLSKKSSMLKFLLKVINPLNSMEAVLIFRIFNFGERVIKIRASGGSAFRFTFGSGKTNIFLKIIDLALFTIPSTTYNTLSDIASTSAKAISNYWNSPEITRIFKSDELKYIDSSENRFSRKITQESKTGTYATRRNTRSSIQTIAEVKYSKDLRRAKNFSHYAKKIPGMIKIITIVVVKAMGKSFFKFLDVLYYGTLMSNLFFRDRAEDGMILPTEISVNVMKALSEMKADSKFQNIVDGKNDNLFDEERLLGFYTGEKDSVYSAIISGLTSSTNSTPKQEFEKIYSGVKNSFSNMKKIIQETITDEEKMDSLENPNGILQNTLGSFFRISCDIFAITSQQIPDSLIEFLFSGTLLSEYKEEDVSIIMSILKTVIYIIVKAAASLIGIIASLDSISTLCNRMFNFGSVSIPNAHSSSGIIEILNNAETLFLNELKSLDICRAARGNTDVMNQFSAHYRAKTASRQP